MSRGEFSWQWILATVYSHGEGFSPNKRWTSTSRGGELLSVYQELACCGLVLLLMRFWVSHISVCVSGAALCLSAEMGELWTVTRVINDLYQPWFPLRLGLPRQASICTSALDLTPLSALREPGSSDSWLSLFQKILQVGVVAVSSLVVRWAHRSPVRVALLSQALSSHKPLQRAQTHREDCGSTLQKAESCG